MNVCWDQYFQKVRLDKKNRALTKYKDEDYKKVLVERMESTGYAGKNLTNFTQVGGEVAKSTSDAHVVIDKVTCKILKRMTDRQMLIIIITTYLRRVLDKGTLSFASIMVIQNDTGLVGQHLYHLPSSMLILS